MKNLDEDRKKLGEQQVRLREVVCLFSSNAGQKIELWGVTGRQGKLAHIMEDRGAGFVPSQARTCECKVDAPQQSPSVPRTLATALIFHMISLPPVLRLALALQTGCIAAPFSAGKIFSETSLWRFITWRPSKMLPEFKWFAEKTRFETSTFRKTWLSQKQKLTAPPPCTSTIPLTQRNGSPQLLSGEV